MYNHRDITKELFIPPEIVSEECVTILAKVQGNEAMHSGFLISFQKKLYVFHYNGSVVEFGELNVDQPGIVLKKILQIRQAEVEAFISYCRQISKMSDRKLEYGFFYTGSFYTHDGVFVSPNGSEEYLTCVGFCISVIKGYINTEYISYHDWDETSKSDYSNYLNDFIRKVNIKRGDNSVDAEKYRKYLRRITPIELTTSAFHKTLPVTKNDIDSNVVPVNECVIDRSK